MKEALPTTQWKQWKGGRCAVSAHLLQKSPVRKKIGMLWLLTEHPCHCPTKLQVQMLVPKAPEPGRA